MISLGAKGSAVVNPEVNDESSSNNVILTTIFVGFSSSSFVTISVLKVATISKYTQFKNKYLIELCFQNLFGIQL